MAATPMDLSDPAPAISHILDIPPELLTLTILKFLPIPSVISLAKTCHPLRAVAAADEVWAKLLARVFPDVTTLPPKPSKISTFASLAATCYQTVQLVGGPIVLFRTDRICPSCHNALLLPDGHRCPCVATRTRLWLPSLTYGALPLCVGGLHGLRSGTSLLNSGFKEMIASLRDHFVVPEVKELELLTPAALAPLDLFILCTTEGPALSEEELDALQAWVRNGGALITSAFANWSAHGHYAASTVRWLGLRTKPHTQFMQQMTHTLDPSTPVDGPTQRLLEHGPFGAPKGFVNKGESLFDVTPEAFEKGATQLVCSSGRRNLLADGVATLVWYPPNDSEQGVTGKGRVLVCSNFHWLCDRSHWMGGTFTSELDNQRLLLNFVAGAIADRIGVWRGDLD